MPFRQKLKKAFRRSPSTSTNTSTSPSPSTSTSPLPPPASSRSSKKPSKKSKPPHPPQTTTSGPVLKYRGPVNPAHQATLSAFRFGSTAWPARRKSGQSQYSPLGSRLPSRVGSVGSLFGRDGGGGGGAGGRKSGQQSRVEEGEGDEGDVGNVGLSRQHTASTTRHANDTEDRPLSTAGPNGGTNGASNGAIPGLETARTATNGDGEPVYGGGSGAGKPFTEDELALALTRSTLRA